MRQISQHSLTNVYCFAGCHQSLRNILRRCNRRGVNINGVEKNDMGCLNVPVSMCTSNTGCVFMFSPIPPAALHYVAFVMATVTCHGAKRNIRSRKAVLGAHGERGSDEDSRTYTHFLSFLSLMHSFSLWPSRFFPQFPLTALYHTDNSVVCQPR